MKKFSIIVCLIIAILALCLSASTPISERILIKTIHPNTNLYQTYSLQGDVVIVIPQNATVTLIGENFYQNQQLWQQIEYESYKGYVLANKLYNSLHNDIYNVKIVKAKSQSMGQKIILYKSHDKSSEKIEICDGTKLNLILNDIDYGEFSKVQYQSNPYYVFTSDITSSLSFNQTIAVIISSIFCGLVIIAIVCIIIIKKRKLLKIK